MRPGRREAGRLTRVSVCVSLTQDQLLDQLAHDPAAGAEERWSARRSATASAAPCESPRTHGAGASNVQVGYHLAVSLDAANANVVPKRMYAE